VSALIALLSLAGAWAAWNAPAGVALAGHPWRAGFYLGLVVLVALAVLSLRRLAALDPKSALLRFGTPLLFGLWVLVFWELLVQAFEVPKVLMPAPSVVWTALLDGAPALRGDFVQTVLHSVLIGLALGCGLGFVVGVLIDRSGFLQRGLLPVASLASTVPLVGVAPIMVMWFGFDWHSKAAVVVVMTFFPMLVNTLAGLGATGHMERDLMRSYGASYWRTLFSLRIPVALPFVFNALKINSTLALIGAIVAEFFGSPVAGLGFRISTEAARLNMGLVWAAIAVAAVAGSALYVLIEWIERRLTFWHPSIRMG
jgi:NitT/TauT family transport system permease protein